MGRINWTTIYIYNRADKTTEIENFLENNICRKYYRYNQ